MKPKKLAREALAAGETMAKAIPPRDIFGERRRNFFLFALLFLALTWWSSWGTEFDLWSAFASFPKALAWLGLNFIPSADSLQYLPRIGEKLLETVFVSITATTTSAVLAFALSLFSSKTTRPNAWVALVVRGLGTFLRSIPVAAWAMIFLFSFGQSPLTGFLAIFMETLGFFIRAFIETVDETSESSVEALRASGASWLHTVSQAVLPSVVPQLVSWILYMIETNIRSATLVGLLTGTGIGFVFDIYYKSMRYPPAGLVVLSIVVVVLLIEILSNRIRRSIQ